MNNAVEGVTMTVIRETAYILRTCKADMTSRNRFVWPREGKVEAPDWRPTAECGNGLHGFLNGEGNGGLADWSPDTVWVVARIEEYIDLGGKVKFPSAEVVFAGSRLDATNLMHDLRPGAAVVGCTLTGGDGSTLTGGDGSTLTGGDGSTLIGGYGSTLTGGYGSTLYIWWYGRRRLVVAYVGEDGIKPDTPYRLDSFGRFVEVRQ